MVSRTKRNNKASAISDRSGIRYPMNEMVIEPGTGFLVHRSESDGVFSLVNHPLNNLNKYLSGKFGDPFPVENVRTDISWIAPLSIKLESININMGTFGGVYTFINTTDYLNTEDGDLFVTEDGVVLVQG